MPGGDYTREEEIKDLTMRRPHVVILGAGASLAAFPNGDPFGKKLPLMNNLVSVVGLTQLLGEAGVGDLDRNFEVIYSELSSDPSLKYVTLKVERKVREYFSKLSLPDKPNLYDYLVLSLRKKDIIATFNWDPFLFLALKRNHKIAPLPHWSFLHGCAIVGACEQHKRQGELYDKCPVCNKFFTPTKLLFPVLNKNYTNDPYIASQWDGLKGALKHAFALTIFGYGAPGSDIGAINLMKEGWGPPEKREFEETEIIDVLPEDLLRERWRPFIFSGHSNIVKDIFESFIAIHPRRTCEAYWQCHLEARFYEGNPFPRFESMEEMWNWYDVLVKYELNTSP